MNILISCAGRQAALVAAFADALGDRGKVFAADSDAGAASLAAASRGFVAPGFASPGYVDWLVETCRDNRVGLLLSLLVDELVVVSAHRARLDAIGCRLVAAPAASLGVAQDKLMTARFCEAQGIGFPRYWTGETVREAHVFPMIAKPRAGRGSRGQRRIETQGELLVLLDELAENAEAYIFQEMIAGEEYGIDVVNDLGGQHYTTFMRRKLAMKNGETYRAVTVDDPALSALGRKLGDALCHSGPLDADLMLKDGCFHLLDLNMRFGGGYMFSHAAGANLPAAMVAWALGEAPEASWLAPRIGVEAVRRDGAVVALQG